MRYPDWPERLARRIERDATVAFAWGSVDCVTWACRVCEELCGVNPSRGFLTAYHDAQSAMSNILQHGTSLFEAARTAGRTHGLPEVPPQHAQRGDLVLCVLGPKSRFGGLLAVVVGAYAVAPGRYGLRKIPLRKAVLAWRV